MDREKDLEGLSLPKLDETPPRARMPWEHKVLYTVETPEGELMSMGPEELERYAAEAQKTGH